MRKYHPQTRAVLRILTGMVAMRLHGRGVTLALLSVLAVAWSAGASANDKLKIAVGMHGNWEDSAPEMGSRAGIFQKHGMELELLYTHGAGEALQAVVSGSVDIGVGVGTAGVMAAFLRGAPVRVVGSATTGTKDIYWYVKSDSRLKTLKDAGPDTTIAYSTAGSRRIFSSTVCSRRTISTQSRQPPAICSPLSRK